MDKNNPEPEKMLSPAIIGPASKRESKVRRNFWKVIKKQAARIPFLPEILAAYYCAFDPNTPTRVRGLLMAALAYFVTPVDLIPDILLHVGFTDDLALLTFVLSTLKAHILPEHHDKVRKFLEQNEKRD